MKVLRFLRLPGLQLGRGRLGREAAGWSRLPLAGSMKSPGRLPQPLVPVASIACSALSLHQHRQPLHRDRQLPVIHAILVPRRQDYHLHRDLKSWPNRTGLTLGALRSIMAPIPGPSSFATFMLNGDTGQAKAPPRTDNKGRKFFQQMQPTFSVDVSPSTSTLEFLDNFDPTKGAVVRKKAREWVNKNREISSLRLATSKTRSKNAIPRTEDDQKKQLAKWKPPVSAAFSPQAVGANTVDPFGVFPNVGRDFGHIIRYCKLYEDSRSDSL